MSEVKPITNELLDLIAKVHQEFSGWCASLKEQGVATQLSTDELLVPTKRLASSTEFEAETETETETEAETEILTAPVISGFG